MFFTSILMRSAAAQFCNEALMSGKFFIFKQISDDVFESTFSSFESATNRCRDVGATLARISSEEDFDTVSALIRSEAFLSLGYWIGVRDTTG